MVENWCTKQGFNTKAKAERAMRSMLRRHGKKNASRGTGAKVSAYKCARCGLWHWGHTGTKTTPKRTSAKKWRKKHAYP